MCRSLVDAVGAPSDGGSTGNTSSPGHPGIFWLESVGPRGGLAPSSSLCGLGDALVVSSSLVLSSHSPSVTRVNLVHSDSTRGYLQSIITSELLKLFCFSAHLLVVFWEGLPPPPMPDRPLLSLLMLPSTRRRTCWGQSVLSAGCVPLSTDCSGWDYLCVIWTRTKPSQIREVVR